MIGRSRIKGSSSATGEQTWRALAGPRRKKLNSTQAKKRRMNNLLRVVGFLVALSVFPALLVFAIGAFREREAPIQINTPSRVIENLIFETDGVLPDRWLGQVIGLRKGTTMMEVDLQAIKEAIEEAPQVKSASIARVFPSALKISIEEHEPVMRLAVQGADGQREQRIVSREGVIYKGAGYSKATLSRLPFVLPYRHPDGSYQPMQGIETVAGLLERARVKNPEFFRTWKVASLEHYSGEKDLPGRIIEIRSTLVKRILFSATMDFDQQLDRLQVIFNYLAQRGDPSVKHIDLSLRGSAAVQFTSGRISSF